MHGRRLVVSVLATVFLAAAPASAAWTGTERLTDDTVNAVSSAPTIKVIYAYPSDQASRLLIPDGDEQVTYADRIQDAALWAQNVVASAPGSQRTLRLDTGIAGNPLALDIQTVKLPNPLSHYQTGQVASKFQRIKDDLASTLGQQQGIRNFLVIADYVSEPTVPEGYADTPQDDQNGPQNRANDGRMVSMVFTGGDAVQPVSQFYDLGAAESLGYYMLHETTHSLGALQGTAPHARGAHATDGPDIMGGAYKTFPCGEQFSIQYDCGQDDYFSPAPAAGSYLATHWNVYRSAFMCPVSDCKQPNPDAQRPADPPAVQPQPPVQQPKPPVQQPRPRPTTITDPRPPIVKVTGPRTLTVKQLKKGVTITVKSDQAGTGTLTFQAGKRKLTVKRFSIGAGKTVKLRVKVPAKKAKGLGKSIRVQVRVQAQDGFSTLARYTAPVR